MPLPFLVKSITLVHVRYQDFSLNPFETYPQKNNPGSCQGCGQCPQLCLLVVHQLPDNLLDVLPLQLGKGELNHKGTTFTRHTRAGDGNLAAVGFDDGPGDG
jgi:hypothetical protein